MITTPAAGRLGDMLDNLRRVLVVCIALAAAVTLGYLPAQGFSSGLEGTAQAIYATVGVGSATALLTLASGSLYARLGAHGFWVMAALCVLALPLAWRLRGAQH